MGIVVAMDGPSGAGKSSTSRAIAVRAGWNYLDTGALYRRCVRVARAVQLPIDDGRAERTRRVGDLAPQAAMGRPRYDATRRICGSFVAHVAHVEHEELVGASRHDHAARNSLHWPLSRSLDVHR